MSKTSGLAGKRTSSLPHVEAAVDSFFDVGRSVSCSRMLLLLLSSTQQAVLFACKGEGGNVVRLLTCRECKSPPEGEPAGELLRIPQECVVVSK